MNQEKVMAAYWRIADANLPQLTDEQEERCEAEAERIRQVVPSHWQFIPGWDSGGRYVHLICPAMSVIFSVAYYGDGRCWIHASIARAKMMPTYEDVMKLKNEFIGMDRKAILVLPAVSEHVNIHEHALHLFCCLDDDPLPDFTMGTGSI